ncbi:MAG: hypothetical protein QOF00_4549, partial [Pseudonocardiales bacterium]|nr:hypothetical protein [Pseudonocardiales bacterium]
RIVGAPGIMIVDVIKPACERKAIESNERF